MIENAKELGMSVPEGEAFDPSLLSHEPEGRLLRALAEFPRVVASAPELTEPHRIARFLEATPSIFNKCYATRECRLLPQRDAAVTALTAPPLVLFHPPLPPIATPSPPPGV